MALTFFLFNHFLEALAENRQTVFWKNWGHHNLLSRFSDLYWCVEISLIFFWKNGEQQELSQDYWPVSIHPQPSWSFPLAFVTSSGQHPNSPSSHEQPKNKIMKHHIPCPSMDPKWFWTVQIILVKYQLFWTGPIVFGQVKIILDRSRNV